jgi:hypothetical protein
MTLPAALLTTTCDVYRGGHAPPAAPDVAGVKCYLEEHFRNIKPGGQGTAPGPYSHLMRVPLGTDIRDSGGTGPDKVWVPDQNGTSFQVIWIARSARGTPLDHKVVYLLRDSGNVSWPTDNL